MTRRKDRYQPRAASASQPKTLKTYACGLIKEIAPPSVMKRQKLWIEWSHDSPSGHQAKADRAPRFRQCLIIAPRSSTCRVQLHWRLGQGADRGRMARVADAKS